MRIVIPHPTPSDAMHEPVLNVLAMQCMADGGARIVAAPIRCVQRNFR
ncbi:MAG: hypothetical protein WA373_08880 [Burkholderiales bacterium]